MAVMSFPFTMMLPEVGLRRPIRCLRSVVFPEPLPPAITVVMLPGTEAVTPLRTSTSP